MKICRVRAIDSNTMTELWKQCAGWLCRLEVLPANHRITWPDATIQDLAYALRDGVLLCHVAAAIDAAAVDMKVVNQRPQMAQFLCLKNIRLKKPYLLCLLFYDSQQKCPSFVSRHFLQACVVHFGLKETDLFQPSMLYDYTDFARVLHTLSKLSNSPKAKAKEVEGEVLFF